MDFQSYVGGCDMFGVINIDHLEACIFGGDGLYMISTCCQGFHGAELLWYRVVVHGAALLSGLLIIYVQACTVSLL